MAEELRFCQKRSLEVGAILRSLIPQPQQWRIFVGRMAGKDEERVDPIRGSTTADRRNIGLTKQGRVRPSHGANTTSGRKNLRDRARS